MWNKFDWKRGISHSLFDVESGWNWKTTRNSEIKFKFTANYKVTHEYCNWFCEVWLCSKTFCFFFCTEKVAKTEFHTDNGLLWGRRWYCWDHRYCRAKSLDNNNILSNKILHLFNKVTVNCVFFLHSLNGKCSLRKVQLIAEVLCDSVIVLMIFFWLFILIDLQKWAITPTNAMISNQSNP